MPRHTILETLIAILAVLGLLAALFLVVGRVIYIATGSIAPGTGGGASFVVFSLTRLELLTIVIGAVAIVVGLALFLWKR